MSDQPPYGHGAFPPPGNIPPPPAPPPPGHGYAPTGPAAHPIGAHYPESSRATTAMVMGIVALAGAVACGIPILLAPVAWIVGQQEITAIDAGRRDPANRGQANAGRIMGIIGTGLMILGIIAVVIVLAVAASSTPT